MAKVTDATVAQQIATLRRLHGRAAAYLAGVSYATLRDRADQCPPDEDGSYDGQSVCRWAARRFGAMNLSDVDREELQRLGEALALDLTLSSCALRRILPDYLRRHGPHGVMVLLTELCDQLDEFGFECPDVPAAGTERIYSLAARLELPTICDRCGRTRNGTTWIKRPRPKDYFAGECGDCRGL